MSKTFRGLFPTLITPFDDAGTSHEPGLDGHVVLRPPLHSRPLHRVVGAPGRAAVHGIVLLPVALVLLAAVASAGETLVDTGFEELPPGAVPAGWATFRAGTTPAVAVTEDGAAGSKRSLLASRSDHGGLVALACPLPSPQSRVLVEFSFAFAPGNGRSLNVWTHEPDGTDASQLNLCIQRGALRQYNGQSRRWEFVSRKIKASPDPDQPVWHRLRAVVDAEGEGVTYWLSPPGSLELPEQPTATRRVYRTGLPIAAVDFVSGLRIAGGSWYRIDDLLVRGGADLPGPKQPQRPPELRPYTLWTGPPIPRDVTKIPLVPGIEHRTVHRPKADQPKFLHGAAIVFHKGACYTHWANSPTNENGPHETLRGRRSNDGGRTWSPLEVIAPGFDGPERHSHGVFLVHDGRLWTFCARFGKGVPGRRFPGLKAEAFVLAPETDRWSSRGIVMRNCWPYDEPVRTTEGNWITGGQDKDGLPVVAISRGDDLTRWDTIAIPHPPALAPSYAETTIWAEDGKVTAVIRGGGGHAWVSVSDDAGRTWSMARPSNLPMPRAKAYLGRLSTGRRFLVSNLVNRNTLVIAVSRPGESTLSRMWRIRHGKSEVPRFPGRAKSPQWSYPYAHEHDGKLYVVYSVGKEECGLSILPIANLAIE